MTAPVDTAAFECAVCHLTSSAHPFISHDLGFGHIVLCTGCHALAVAARGLVAA